MKQSLEILLEAFEDLLLTKMADGIAACGGSEAGAQCGVLDQESDGGMERGRVFGRNDESAGVGGGSAADDQGDLGAGIGGGDDGTAAGEHASELGGHDEIGRAGALRQQMDVGCVEEIVEAVDWLQRQKGDVGTTGDKCFQLGAKGSVAAEEEGAAG